jgi:ATP-dependent DNA helicase RecG
MKKEEFEVLIEELRALPQESEWVEFKVNNSKPDEIGEYISALSNSACLENKEFGYLVYGIEDKTHKIAGTDFTPKAKKIGNQELEN